MASEVESPPRRRTVVLEDDREVDFGRYGRSVLSRWWLVLLAIVIGAAIGFLVSRTGGKVFKAEATVYLGTPLTPSGGGGIASTLGTSSTTIAAIAGSQSVVQEVAAKVGLPVRKLRNGISTRSLAGAAKNQTPPPLAAISVRGQDGKKVAAAANLLAAIVVQKISGYANVKIQALGQQLAAENRELGSIDKQLTSLTATVRGAAGLSSLERLALTTLLTTTEQRQTDLVTQRAQTQQLLTLAQDFEKGKILARAAPQKVSARSRKTSVVVGAFIGLLAGVALALLWEPLLGGRRLRPRAP
ncbi:MAG: hypothetical protein E6G67_00955 [Actinobacteria bacterium]|nr:MAG: hypothetical protein E6G67_00955 [Actinomycetota bacterium]